MPERGLRAKLNFIDDFIPPEQLNWNDFKNENTEEVLEYISLIYERFPDLRTEIIKGLIVKMLEEELHV